MADRPWEDAEFIVAALEPSGTISDMSTHAAAVDAIAIDFRIDAARPWESSRQMRSSIALDEEGVFVISLRLPEADPRSNLHQSRKVIEAAAEATISDTGLPEQSQYKVRGGSDAWHPHIEWNGKPGSVLYNYEDDEEHHIQPRRAARLAENAIDWYRTEVDNRR